jgi:putative transposase
VEVEAMSQQPSPSTHQPYGVARVIRVWDLSRSTFYARRARRQARPTPRRRRRPPRLDDAALLEQIRAVIAESPFTGEGHRKIWARLRVGKHVSYFKRRMSRSRLIRSRVAAIPEVPPYGKPPRIAHNAR